MNRRFSLKRYQAHGHAGQAYCYRLHVKAVDVQFHWFAVICF